MLSMQLIFNNYTSSLQMSDEPKFLAENRPKVLSKGERLPFLQTESAYKKCLREE